MTKDVPAAAPPPGGRTMSSPSDRMSTRAAIRPESMENVRAGKARQAGASRAGGAPKAGAPKPGGPKAAAPNIDSPNLDAYVARIRADFEDRLGHMVEI